MPIIHVDSLKKYYGKVKAVDGISFDVEQGEIFGFLGPNGAGKTTTIRCIMDLLRPDSGTIRIFGKDAHDYATELRRDIGFLPGEVNLYNSWTGQDYISLTEKVRGMSRLDEELMDRFNYDAHKKVGSLSTGNKQKLALILALMHKPKLLILDEPTTGLDPLLQHSIHSILQNEAEKGTTIFMSSHFLAEVEKLCTRVCIIKQGKIVATEKVHELRKKRIYSITLLFDKKIPREKLLLDGVEIEKENRNSINLTVKGDIKPILNVITQLDVKDIEITHASLEEVFMEYYR